MIPKPPSEVDIDSDLVRALLREQCPDLSSLSLVEVGEGWDNRIFRLGQDLAVRIPRRAASAILIEHEQRWLPEISASLPLPVPVPVRAGRPGCGFPWRWSVVPWLSGESALVARWDPPRVAAGLGQFLRRLHRPAPDDAPANEFRGVPLARRDQLLRKHLEQLKPFVNRDAVLRVWDLALSAFAWQGPPLWIHGDLHPANLLVASGRLSAVIDFGDLTAGDPATDLAVMWILLPSAARPVFLSSLRPTDDPLDRHTWMRARGWALALGLALLASSQNDPRMGATGQVAIKTALKDG